MRAITGSPLKSFQESIKGSNDSRDLIGALNAYFNDVSEPSREEAVNNAVDFLRRWMKSDNYKSQIGGAPMMRSEIGDEESAMYEKIRRAGDEVEFKGLPVGTYGLASPLNDIARYLDYRSPVFRASVNSNASNFDSKHNPSDNEDSAVHELYHAVSEPSNIGRYYESNTDSRYYGKERTGNVLEYPEGLSEYDPKPFISPRNDYSSMSGAGRDIYYQRFVVDDDPNSRASSIYYFRNPTELSARTRDITNFLQREGEIPEDKFSLDYDDILKAYEMGHDAAKELLYALGVYTHDGSNYFLREDLIPESKEKYNMYLKGKL